MSTSIKKQYTYSPSQEQIENRRILTDILTDLTVLRTAITTLTAKVDTDFAAQNTQVDLLATEVDTLVTKMNADFTAQNAAVTSSQLDTDYAATSAASQLDVDYATSVDPAALVVTA